MAVCLQRLFYIFVGVLVLEIAPYIHEKGHVAVRYIDRFRKILMKHISVLYPCVIVMINITINKKHTRHEIVSLFESIHQAFVWTKAVQTGIVFIQVIIF